MLRVEDIRDPIERIIIEALDREGFTYTADGCEGGQLNMGLDFYLVDYDIYIEVKQFHSDRIADQMSRADNVIAVQGRESAEFVAAILCDYLKERPIESKSKSDSS